jgi:hypothetical protein
MKSEARKKSGILARVEWLGRSLALPGPDFPKPALGIA